MSDRSLSQTLVHQSVKCLPALGCDLTSFDISNVYLTIKSHIVYLLLTIGIIRKNFEDFFFKFVDSSLYRK